MKTTVKLVNVDDLRCQLKIEMTVGELRRLREQLGKAPDWTSWPLAGIRELADETIRKAEQEFCASQESE